MSKSRVAKEPKKPKTLSGDDISIYSLKSLLDAFGSTIYKAPEKWLYGLKFAPEELAKYPTLGKLLTSKVIVVNFAPTVQTRQKKQAA